MISILDGPAKGERLLLRRAPFFLRVTIRGKGKSQRVDALDQISDRPQAGEQVHVYRRQGKACKIHIYGGYARGWFAVAEYRQHDSQPDDATTRDNRNWQAWAREEFETLHKRENHG